MASCRVLCERNVPYPGIKDQKISNARSWVTRGVNSGANWMIRTISGKKAGRVGKKCKDGTCNGPSILNQESTESFESRRTNFAKDDEL